MGEKRKCLIVEGGGFKTAFTTGILDALSLSDDSQYEGYIGVSGGAIAISYFLSQQFRFCFNAMQILSKDKNFMQYKRTFGTEGIMNIDYLEKVAKEKVPFDMTTALEKSQGKYISFVATNRRYGNSEYLEPKEETWIDSVIASCTLPFVTKGKHKIKGKAYFDGGWSDPLPVKKAHDLGFNHITVLRTSPKDRKTTQSWSDYFGSIYFSKRPELSECFSKCYENYNSAIDFMTKPPKETKVIQIAPEEPLKSGTYSYSSKTIVEDYRHGLDLGLQHIKK